MAVGVLLAACSSDVIPGGVGGGTAPPTTGECRTPTEGCACTTGAPPVDCGNKIQNDNGATVCAIGTRSCVGGTWTACMPGPRTATAGLGFATIKPLALGTSQNCTDPCDLDCRQVTDTPAGTDAGPGFSVDDAGITLSGTTACNMRFTGRVEDPGGNNPLSNVDVFLREGALRPFVDGVAADTCATLLTGGPSGPGPTYSAPTVRTKTATDGTFNLILPTAVSSGGGPVELVIQTGRWRRVFPMGNADCATHPVAPLRLPANRTQGDIPLTAVVMSEADTTECLLRKIGIDATEFTSPTGGGRIQLYRGSGGDNGSASVNGYGPALAGGAPHFGPAPSDHSLLGSAVELAKYSLLALPCVGSLPSTVVRPADFPTIAEANNVRTFANAGGRIFATHLSDFYLRHPGPPVTEPHGAVATWASTFTDFGNVGVTNATVNTVSPRGLAFRDWMQATGSLTMTGRVAFADANRRSILALAPAETWLPNDNVAGIPFYNYHHHVTFDTPMAGPPAGRVVYLSSHIGPTSDRRNSAPWTFPSECRLTSALNPGERALEYMMFDLSACVGAPTPTPPPVFSTRTYVREIAAECPTGTSLRWTEFNYGAITPSDSRIDVTVQTGVDVAAATAMTPANVSSASGATRVPTAANAFVIDAPNQPPSIISPKSSRRVLRFSFTFVPDTAGAASPTLTGMTQKYACSQSE